LLALDSRLEAVLRGEMKPNSPESMRVLAKVAFLQKRYGASAALYRSAFARMPVMEDKRDIFLDQAHRYSAARAAILSGLGKGKDAEGLDESDRIRWRKLALKWLKEELAAIEDQFDRETASGKESIKTVAATLKAWKTGGFKIPYGPDTLTKLPDQEKSEWKVFWKAVDELLGKAR